MTFDHAVDFETHCPVDKMSHWMKTYCQGEWELLLSRVVETPEGQLRKNLQIMFECEQDKGQFTRHFAIS